MKAPNKKSSLFRARNILALDSLFLARCSSALYIEAVKSFDSPSVLPAGASPIRVSVPNCGDTGLQNAPSVNKNSAIADGVKSNSPLFKPQ